MGIVYAALWSFPRTGPDLVHGMVAICGCYVISMFTFVIRAYCRLPRECSLAAKPIRKGVWASLLGGSAYGACVAVGVTLAYCYVMRPTWDYTVVKFCLIAQVTTIAVCGAVMIPVGFLAGLIYSLYKWKHTEQCDAREARESSS
ncbi:hypothetical protein Rcae01_00015 [Novipirellula caenicola]|uniref:Transmembrane protein n=2 Tax=Novipirellula caenicola TaxID=1536901 RepID=A0ABP9VIT5_9BACT